MFAFFNGDEDAVRAAEQLVSEEVVEKEEEDDEEQEVDDDFRRVITQKLDERRRNDDVRRRLAYISRAIEGADDHMVGAGRGDRERVRTLRLSEYRCGARWLVAVDHRHFIVI